MTVESSRAYKTDEPLIPSFYTIKTKFLVLHIMNVVRESLLSKNGK